MRPPVTTRVPGLPRRRILVAANPYSGARDNRARIHALAAALEWDGAEVRILWEPATRAAALGDARVLGSCECVVAAGGDGTAAQVINELASRVPLGLLPLGNENVLAKALGFRDDPDALARAVAAGRTRTIDLGRATAPGGAHARLFALMLSVGFDAEVVHRVARWRAVGATLRRVRRASYLPRIVGALAGYAHVPVELDAGGVSQRAAHCVVANVPAWALGLRLAPRALPDDGRLDWVAFTRPGRIALARYAWAVWRGHHSARRDVATGRAARLVITALRPVPVQVDGDPWGLTPVEVDTLPGALTVLAP